MQLDTIAPQEIPIPLDADIFVMSRSVVGAEERIVAHMRLQRGASAFRCPDMQNYGHVIHLEIAANSTRNRGGLCERG
jgi:hypothetical protein